MKILNVENNKLVAYVQIKNLKSLVKHGEHLPRRFYKFAKELGLSENDDTKDEEFISTTDKKIIKTLIQADWIIDFRELRDLSDEELQSACDELTVKIQDLASYYNSLPYTEQRVNSYMPVQYAKAVHKLNDINAYLKNRQGTYPSPFEIPLAMDSKAGIVSSNGNLRFGQSLDHKKILIGRKDEQPFQHGFHINPIEVNMGLMVFMAEENLTPTEPGQMDLTIRPDGSHKFLIAEYSFQRDPNYIPPVVEETHPTRLKPNQKKKTIFNPNKKDEN